MKRLLDNIFCSDTPSDVAIVSGVNVLLTAIERRCSPAICIYARHVHTFNHVVTTVHVLARDVQVYMYSTCIIKVLGWLDLTYCTCAFT